VARLYAAKSAGARGMDVTTFFHLPDIGILLYKNMKE
jgi:hypothetical protein